MKMFNGDVYELTGRSWSNIRSVPVGALFAPYFDDLVHPMKRTAYRMLEHGVCVDQEDDEHLSSLTLHDWWCWVGEYVEVTPV
jgi:hypothetical protein